MAPGIYEWELRYLPIFCWLFLFFVIRFIVAEAGIASASRSLPWDLLLLLLLPFQVYIFIASQQTLTHFFRYSYYLGAL